MTSPQEVAIPITCVTATAASATAVTATAVAEAGRRVICFVAASCSGAASGPVTLTVKDGATAVLALDLSLTVGVPYVLSIPGGIVGTAGNAMSAILSAGATSCVGKLTIGFDVI
jgi:hypothetical protein